MNKYFIYTGNAYPHKNLGRLIEAIKIINNRRGQSVKLKIVSGRSVFLDRLKKQIYNLNAEKLIEIIGFVDDRDLNTLYKNSAAFVFPTLDEGFGLPPMEAVNAGTLAAVSDIPVLKEVYQRLVFYFDPLDINSIANTLDKVLNLSEEERNKKINQARQFLKRYSWEKMAVETLRVYNQAYGL